MNKRSVIFYLGVLSVLLGCFQPKFNAKDTAREFLIAVENGDYDVAKKFGTEATKQQLDMMESLDSEPKRREPRIKRVDEDYDDATAYYYFVGEEDKELELALQRDGKKGWLVETTKGDLQGSDTDFGLEDTEEEYDYGSSSDYESADGYDEIYDLEGDLDYSMDIEMNLRVNGTVVEGSYIYSDVGHPLSLIGFLDESTGELELSEFNRKGKLTGTFTGNFSELGGFHGTWENGDGEGRLGFNLEEDGEGGTLNNTQARSWGDDKVIFNNLLSYTEARVWVDNLRVRTGPDMDAEMVDEFPEGSTVTLRGYYSYDYEVVTLRNESYTSPWFEVEYGDYGATGWVFGGGLELPGVN